MECFVAYTRLTPIDLLAQTLNAWDKSKIIPAAIQCKPVTFEFDRRVAAEGLATGDYILADVGCLPKRSKPINAAVKMLYQANGSPVGMVVAEGFRVCRKGVIDKWPMKESADYGPEHRLAYERKGYKVVDAV